MEIYALGLLVMFGLIGVALRVSKGAGHTEAKFESGEKYIESIAKAAKEAKQNEKEVSTLSRDMLRQRLSE